MPNIAAVLKEEIRRLAKREIKANTSSTKGAVAQYRRDIATLKRQMQTQGKEIAFLKAQERKRLGQDRCRRASGWCPVLGPLCSRPTPTLGLSQPDYAKLVGVSAMTIYNWEAGKSRPRESSLPPWWPFEAREAGGDEKVGNVVQEAEVRVLCSKHPLNVPGCPRICQNNGVGLTSFSPTTPKRRAMCFRTFPRMVVLVACILCLGLAQAVAQTGEW